ncbi:MAG: hypothetical protein II306_06405 [Clostridia bacterium]|nr:hypothetical protein [Clostridia bacterium]
MTTELEQEFFKTFGIKPQIYVCYIGFDRCIDIDFNCHCHNEKPCKNSILVYPEITDRFLLELICICSYFCGTNFHNLWAKNIPELEAMILEKILLWYASKKYGHEKCKHQIQQLFKEEE